MFINKYPRMLHYRGILCEWIFRKLIMEMKDYGLNATFDIDVLYKINEFLIDWIMKYINFFKKTNHYDSFIATHNLIKNKSRLKDYVMDRVNYFSNYTNLPIVCQIGNNLYITKDKEYFPREFFYQLKLTFPLFILKQISHNEYVDLGNNVDYALFNVAIGTILELLIYLLFNDVDGKFNNITLEHTENTINTLNFIFINSQNDFDKNLNSTRIVILDLD